MKYAFKVLWLMLSMFVVVPVQAQNDRDLELVRRVKRVALVIGNANYGEAPLRNTLNDTIDMAATLERLGFDVITGTNLNNREMEEKIREFGRRLGADGIGVFYYSGHGMEVGGQNYLIPIGCRLDKEEDVRFEAVDAERVLAEMEAARNPLNILILDACRNNPFVRRFRAGSKGLAQMEAPQGSFIAYATAPRKTASDNPEGRNGLYTQELLRNIQTRGLGIEDVFKRTRIGVMERSNGQQVPWDATSLRYDFYFTRPGNSPQPQPAPPRVEPPRVEPPRDEPPRPTEPTTDSTRINPRDGAEMVYVPAGEFVMGSKNNVDDAKPQRRVYLDGYWVYKTEVTVDQYRGFCTATGRQMPEAPKWGWKDDHPIVNVSWDDCTAYCKWAGVSLPTEAQWEKAARGVDGRVYPWGNEWDANRLQCSVNGEKEQPMRVGFFRSGASPYGCLDMAGNVAEWCADWYHKSYYMNAPESHPTGPTSGQKRVVRGGSWRSGLNDFFGTIKFYAAYRFLSSPDFRSTGLGFRCVQGR